MQNKIPFFFIRSFGSKKRTCDGSFRLRMVFKIPQWVRRSDEVVYSIGSLLV